MRKQLLTQVMVSRRLLLTSLLLLVVGFTALAQSPGGVPTTLEAWYRADAGVNIAIGSVANEVDLWSDQGTAVTRDATQTVTANMPTLLDLDLNFNPTIEFNTNGADDKHLNTLSFSDLVNKGYTIIAVGRRTLVSGANNFYLGQDGSTDGAGLNQILHVGFRNNGNRFTHGQGGNDVNITIPVLSGTTNDAFLANASLSVTTGKLSKMYIENSSPRGNIQNNTDGLVFSDPGYLGKTFYSEYQGTLSEVLVYRRALTDIERQKVESYLAVKYGFSLSTTQVYYNSNFVPVFDPSKNTGYTTDIFGVGRDDATALNQKVSRSVNDGDAFLIASLENDFTNANYGAARTVTHANDFQYMLFGSNGLTATAQTTEVDNTTLGAAAQGIEREWRVRATANFTQTVSLQFGGLDNTYTLIKDADGDFSTGVTVVGALDANGIINEVTLADGEYFTVVSGEVIPQITLVGEANISVEIGAPYTEQGATAFDNVDGDISGSVVVGGDTVNVNVAGTYTVTYNVDDAAGNSAVEVTRSVIVSSDNVAPVITLIGDATITQPEGSTYTDQGALAQDDVDGDVTSNITTSGSVNTSVAGTYTITYSVLDAANNLGQATRTVIITDNTAPVITLIGSSSISHTLGNSYTDDGATALDNTDGDLTSSIAIVNPVDINVAGTYIITYNVSDAAGNAATEVTRTVSVSSDPTIPVITLLGDATVSHSQGAVYADAGATATDDSGDLTLSIVVGGDTVNNTTVVGTYTITYNVTDNVGNAATEVTRTVNVISDTTPPTITLIGGDFSQDVNGPAYNDAGATAIDDSDGDITANIVVGGDTVDITTVGTYTITYNVSDAAGNAATEVTRTVTITADSTPPTITLNGGNVTQEVGGAAYSDAGATAVDSIDGVLTGSIVVGGDTVDVNIAGVYTITYNVSDAAGNAATEVTRTVTITKANQTITFAALANKTFGDADFTLGATSDSGLTVTYASSDTSVATVSGNTVTVVGVGTTTITASQAGNASYYNAATDVAQTLTVGKANQTITFGALTNKTFGDADFTLGATSDSGLTVSYASSDISVATVSGNTVTIVGAGTTTITASQAGDASYNAATDVPQTLTVDKLSQTITFGALASQTVGSPDFTLGATSDSGLTVSYASSDTSVATVSGNTVTIVGAGTTTITASQAGDASYNAATDVPQTLTVDKLSQTITFGALANKTVSDTPFTLNATSDSGLTVSYASSDTSVATVSGNTVTIVGAGTTTITASQAGDASYNAATDVPQTLTVDKLSQTITFAALANKTFGDADFTLGASSDSGLTVSYASSDTSVATVSGNTVTIVGAGTTTITASQAGDASYNAATDVPQTLTVDKLSQTITFGALASQTVGSPDFTLGASSDSGLTVSYASSDTSVATVSGNTVTIVGAGTTTITASQAGDASYNAATDVPQTLTVDKLSQTITFGALANKTVSDTPFTLNATSDSGLTVTYASSDTSVATVSGNTVTIVGAGTTTITASQAGDASYNAATDVPQTLTVDKLSQTITFGALANKTVSDTPFTLNATSDSGLTVTYASSDTSVATVSGNTVTIVGAGTTTITASQAGNASYYNAATDVAQTLTVDKLSQTITFGALANKTVSDTPFTLNATSDSGLTVTYASSDTSVATVSGNTVTIVGVGTTTITASQAGDASYNAATDATQTLTVGKANQTITFGALGGKTVGGADFDLEATSSSELAVSYTSSDTSVATVSGSTVTIVGAGTTTITASQAGDASYNAAADVAQTLTVNNKLSQTITFGALANKTVSDTPFTLNATSDSGLTVTYASSDTSVATVSGNTVTIVGAGTTTITASQAGDASYNAATDVPQTLTVDKLSQTITFGALVNKTVSDTPFTLNATSDSGLTVTYASSDTSVATVSGNTVTIVGAGTTTITASQVGDASYNAATDVPQTLTVDKLSQTITFGALASQTVGSPDFTLGATSDSGLTVSYASSDTSVATVSGNTVTIVGVGTTTITASQAGDATYSAATDVAQTLTVTGPTEITGDDTVTTDVNGNVDITSTGSLTVNNDANINGDVEIADGGELTLNGTGTITGDVTITDGGSLIATDGAVTGTVTYQRNVPTTNWYLISSLVTGQDKDTFVGASNLATSGTNVGFSDYDNATGAWSYYQSGTIAGTTGNFVSGEGHAVKLNAAGSVSFSGSFNNADVSVAVSSGAANNFNLIGNPYLASVSVSEMVTTNNALLTEQTVWLWDQAADAYVQKNLATDLEVVPGQGFFVSANAAGNFSITEAMQSHNATNTFQRVTRPEVSLTLSNGEVSRTAEIFYINGTTKGFDNGYDSSIFEGFANEFAVYTRAVANGNGRNLGIQSLPQGAYESMIVPVGVNAVAGSSLEFSARSANLPAGTYVYLEDKNTNTFTRIDNATYRVTASSDLNGVGQFYIHTTSSVLAAPTNTLDNVSVYASNNETLKVEGITEGQAQVRMYSILGKQVINTTITGNGNNRVALPKLQTGVYLVEVQSAQGTLNKKLIIE